MPNRPSSDRPQPPLSEVPIRRLTQADVPACLALGTDRGWAAEEKKWRFLLKVGLGYGLDAPGGGLAATAVLTPYDAGLAAVGMVLVAARYNGQGLGRRMMTHLCQVALGAPLTLYATEAGRPLYEQLGFRTLGTNTTHVGRFRGLPGAEEGARPMVAADRAAILALDAGATGVNRGRVLEQLLACAEQVWVLEREGQPEGYAVAWRNLDQVVIGPVIAPDTAGAQALVAAVATAVDDVVRLEVDTRRPEMLAWARAQGLEPTITTSLMLRGAARLPGQRERVFAPITVALD